MENIYVCVFFGSGLGLHRGPMIWCSHRPSQLPFTNGESTREVGGPEQSPLHLPPTLRLSGKIRRKQWRLRWRVKSTSRFRMGRIIYFSHLILNNTLIISNFFK